MRPPEVSEDQSSEGVKRVWLQTQSRRLSPLNDAKEENLGKRGPKKVVMVQAGEKGNSDVIFFFFSGSHGTSGTQASHQSLL